MVSLKMWPWIDTLGVRNEYKRKGIARLLFKEMFSMFKKVGVDYNLCLC